MPRSDATADSQRDSARQHVAGLAQLSRPSLVDSAQSDVSWTDAAVILLDDFQVRWLELLVDWLHGVADVIQRRMEHSPATDAGRT